MANIGERPIRYSDGDPADQWSLLAGSVDRPPVEETCRDMGFSPVAATSTLGYFMTTSALERGVEQAIYDACAFLAESLSAVSFPARSHNASGPLLDAHPFS